MNNWNSETAEWYAKNYGDYATNIFGVDELKLASDSTVVDIGCGTGSALRYASDKVTNGKLIGIDPVPRMLEIANEQTANHAASDRIAFYEGSAENLPIEDTSADFVFAFDSFDHWLDHEKGLKEVRRILKPTGLFIIVKDGGLPNGRKAKNEFKSAIEIIGFIIVEEKFIIEGNIKCTRWVCSVED